ncbi:MAG: hypothetical protein ACLR6B_10320 [Blautia sp.]
MKNGHRPMRRQKREVTSPEELRRILEKCQILRIGAMDEEGMSSSPSTMVLSGRTNCSFISIRQRKAGKLMPSARIQMWPSSWTVVTR